MKYLFCILISLFYIGDITAQNTHLYNLSNYSSKELSSNLFNKIIQDSYGFIWIATDYGLNKYDGMKTTQYIHLKSDSTSLNSNNVRTLMLDKDSILWIGTSKGLHWYDTHNDSFKSITFPNNSGPHISNVIELANGQIWATTAGEGIFSINKKNSTATYLDEITRLIDKSISHIYQDKQQNIWFGVNDKGLIRMDPISKKTKTFSYPDIPSNYIICLLEDDNDKLYMSTSISVCSFDKKLEKFTQVEWKDQKAYGITDMALGQNGNIYVSAQTKGQGLNYIDKNTGKILTYKNTGHTSVLNTGKILDIFEDRDRNLWIGCFLKGLFVIPNKSTQFDFFDVANNENDFGNIITSIYKDHYGDVWYAIDRVGLIKYKNKDKTIESFTEIDDVYSIIGDSKNNIWIASYSKGLAKMDPNTGKCSFLNIPRHGYMKTMVEGLDGCLYISTFGAGFIQYDPHTGSHKEYNMKQEDSKNDRLGNDWINSILCDSEGLIWLGHYKGVSCFDPKTNRFVSVKNYNILEEQICISLIESSDGNIWAGTYNGLFCIQKKTQDLEVYTVENGLSSNVICGLAEDKEGDIWCSTFKGINQLKRKENRIINYYTGNGLFDKIYNRGVYFKDNNERIYFGGNNGITSFHPENITTPSYDYQILTTNVYVRNQPINLKTLSGGKRIIESNILTNDSFEFSYEDNSFTFEFSTMDFIDSENIYYEYRLKELSKAWTPTSPGVNQITYNHLNPGNYTLEVRACKYGAYSSTKQLFISVSPPWYKSNIAYFLYLCLLSAIGVLVFILIRKKRNEEINESKLQYFINISHEMRSPLTLIISPLEKLLKGNYDNDTTKILQRMYRNSSRILGLINQLLDIRKFDKGQMKLKFSETKIISFTQDLFDVFEYQASKRNIRFVLKHSMDEVIVWIDRNNFDKILMNLLSNAFKYTPDGGEIIITLGRGINKGSGGPLRNYLELNILDSGIGLEDDKTDKIFERFYQGKNQETFTTMGSGIGLNLTRILVLLHAGSISAKNREDTRGSCFTVRIPLGKDHIKKDEFVDNIQNTRPILQQGTFIHNTNENGNSISKRNRNSKILIIDDEEEIRDFLTQELCESYKIITAVDGVEGFKFAVNHTPDLIISDVMMPNMDGFNLIKKLKSNNNVSHIPVILLTSKTEHQDRIEGLGKGADAYLTKPFNIEELIITVNNLIINRKLLKGKFSGAQDQEDKIKSVDFKSGDDLLMERVSAVINDNISNTELNVNMLASEVGLSRSQLHRRLKEITGISPVDFIRNIRLKQAANLLKEKKMDVSLVAYSVGLTNQAYFSTIFKKYYGISPSEYILQSKIPSK